MAKILRRIAAAAICAAALATFIALPACAQNGRDGRDGEDFNFYDMYEAVNAERVQNGEERLTVSEFVEMYFGMTSGEVQEAISQQAIMNRSLLSSVTIMADYTTSAPIFGSSTHSVFAGTGVMVDVDTTEGDAYIVTNAHVVYESDYGYCEDLYVYLYGSDEEGVDYYSDSRSGALVNVNGIPSSQVEIIGVSRQYDLAVLKVEDSEVIRRSNAVAAQFAQDEYVVAGESVYAVGNADGLGLSITRGIISRESEWTNVALSENADGSVNLDDVMSYRVMRTDAAVNGGNSGGGLFNYNGEMVGIINSKNEADGIDNMAYALPTTYARRVVQSMIDTYESGQSGVRYVEKATIGIEVEASDSYAVYNSEKGETVIKETVRVDRVTSPSALARGVLFEGDVIKSMSVGVLEGGTTGWYDVRNQAFTVPENQGEAISEHYFTIDISRDYMVVDAMFSVRLGDTVEFVIERDGAEKYVYFVFDNVSYFAQYN